MNAISNYLAKQHFTCKIPTQPSSVLKVIVVIPCRAEPDLEKTIHSLEYAAKNLNSNIEIIVVLNDHDQDNDDIILQNVKTKDWLEGRSFTIPIHSIYLNQIPFDIAGVGYARKQGMDEAIFRFDLINRYSGIICSMDADTLVSENYFVEVINAFEQNRTECLVIHYEHVKEGLPLEQKLAIVLYELHLRYYIEALKWAGFPHAYQTLGSAIAVLATGYAAQGGMPAKQAGEDFYFVQKFSKLNKVQELNTATVYPSPRISFRVPFGTGKAIGDMMNNKIEWGITYPFVAFKDLSFFIRSLELLYNSHWESISLPKSISSFLKELKFDLVLNEIKANTASKEKFINRFFQKMDAFMMMKFIHFARDYFYGNGKVVDCAIDLLKELDITPMPSANNPEELLEIYRALQKKTMNTLK